MPTRKPPAKAEPPIAASPPAPKVAPRPAPPDDPLRACYAELTVLRDFLQGLAINPAVPPGIKVEINRRTAATGLVVAAVKETLKK